eukprot:3884636-Pleurochrysis_carterae.AAC.5
MSHLRIPQPHHHKNRCRPSPPSAAACTAHARPNRTLLSDMAPRAPDSSMKSNQSDRYRLLDRLDSPDMGDRT